MKVIITGASQGIGRGIATVLAREGFAVGLLARNKAKLQELACALREEGAVAHCAVCDVRNPQEVARAVGELTAQLGGLDALINNAGLVLRKSVTDIADEEWQALLNTNVSGVFYCIRAVLPHFQAQQAGHIINVSSISGKMPLAGGSAYAATKFAVAGFSQSIFQELREFGIKVTTVYPGSVDSQSHRHDAAADHSWKVTPEEVGSACAMLLRTRPENCISELEIRPLFKGARG
jgi:3-oxoacyl-[acyl-carrier protein] reductase